ncbi:MAG: hypothetical protein J2P15_19655 [Micromonosporaceae bacterium]|nr:hypothetical protein [Micromonosporaceae bacterium]
MRGVALVVGVILGLYLIGRAIAEPFLIDFSDPSTYHLAWGGPHLIGVLAVHCGPGIVSAAWMVSAVLRRSHRRSRSR